MVNVVSSFVASCLLFFSVPCTVVSSSFVEQEFRQCLLSTPVGMANTKQCLGTGVLSQLRSWDNDPEFDLVDGVSMIKDPKEYREAYSFDNSDPSSFRSLIESVGQVFSRRQMKWDMSSIYPGLTMHLTPSPDTAGYLEFAVDPHKEAASRHILKEASTAKLLVVQNLLLPLLLGFKIKVIFLIPIIFGVLALIAKKALVLSKISLILSSAIGLGMLLLGQNRVDLLGQGIGPQVFNNHHYTPPAYHVNRFPNHYGDEHYRSNNLENGLDNNAASSSDQLKLPENLQEIFSTGIGKKDRESGRNFAWDDEEKLKKIKG